MKHSDDAKQIELGKSASYPDRYDAALLVSIPRSFSRSALAQSQWFGRDDWTAYELSWLNARGVPQVAVAEFSFDAQNPAIVESKSFKYYLNSFNQSRFESAESVRAILQRDLSATAGGQVQVHLQGVSHADISAAEPEGICVDALDVEISRYQPDSDLLAIDEGGSVAEHCLYSHLLKSNCPVTGQPDWATLWIKWKGQALAPESFLRYVVAFRQYQGFHESCVERVFADLLELLKPEFLQVYARYTRRGGLDINPYRCTANLREAALPFARLPRQ